MVLFLLAASDRVVAALKSRYACCAVFVVRVSQSLFAVFSVNDARCDAKPNAFFPFLEVPVCPDVVIKMPAAKSMPGAIKRYRSLLQCSTSHHEQCVWTVDNNGARVPQLKSCILPCLVKAKQTQLKSCILPFSIKAKQTLTRKQSPNESLQQLLKPVSPRMPVRAILM